jgi:hypothetical protein
MKRLAVALLALTVAFVSAACDDDNPTTPDNSVTFTAQLSPANEVPPVTDAEATGSGTVTIRIDLTRDSAGTITAATANFTVNLTGFPGTTQIILAHIHGPASPGSTAGVKIDTGITAGQITLTNGAASFTRNGIPVTAPVLTTELPDMIANPSSYYFNVHSQLHGSGVVRGTLAKQ